MKPCILLYKTAVNGRLLVDDPGFVIEGLAIVTRMRFREKINNTTVLYITKNLR